MSIRTRGCERAESEVAEWEEVEGGRKGGSREAISQEGFMGFWARKGCESLALPYRMMYVEGS